MPKFRRKPRVVKAERLKKKKNNCDWLITDLETGEQTCCKNETFMELYEPYDREAEDYLSEVGTKCISPLNVELSNKDIEQDLLYYLYWKFGDIIELS